MAIDTASKRFAFADTGLPEGMVYPDDALDFMDACVLWGIPPLEAKEPEDVYPEEWEISSARYLKRLASIGASARAATPRSMDCTAGVEATSRIAETSPINQIVTIP